MPESDQSDDGRPPWDAALAGELMGSLVLVGITYLDHNEELVCKEQMYGRVVAADPKRGVCLKLEGVRNGKHYWFPPSMNPYEEAGPGTYTLRSTGEKVENPDYLATWTVTAPPPDETA